MFKQRKALMAVVAVSLLLVVSISTFLYFQSWFVFYQDDFQTQLEVKKFENNLEVVRVDWDLIYLKNDFQDNLNITSIKINGVECNLRSNSIIDKGTQTINISDCTYGFQNVTAYDVGIFTDYGVLNEIEVVKDVYLKYVAFIDSFIAENNPVVYNTSTNLTWVIDKAQSCTASGNWSGSKSVLGGTESTGLMLENKTYILTCTHEGGDHYLVVELGVAFPVPEIVSFFAIDNPVVYNTSTNLTWSIVNASSCTASGDWSGSKDSISGTEDTGELIVKKNYTLTCSHLGGNINQTISVLVISYINGSSSDHSSLGSNPFTISNLDYGANQTENSFVVALVGWWSTGTDTLTSATIGGVAATIEVQGGDVTNSNNRRGAILTATPTGTSGEVVLTFDSKPQTVGVEMWTLFDYNQTPSVTQVDYNEYPNFNLNVYNNSLSLSLYASKGVPTELLVPWIGVTGHSALVNSEVTTAYYESSSTGMRYISYNTNDGNAALLAATWERK